MAKLKKKRNKVYTGQDASITRPTVTRLSAANRSKAGQWWYEKKRFAKPVLIASLVIIIVVWLVVELVRVLVRSGA